MCLRWSAIATHLPKRTDNEIKNYWNTHLKKRLDKMGIDPITHKPKNDALRSGDGQTKSAANLSHMAQWESARLEAEARLARQSRIRISTSSNPPQAGSISLPPTTTVNNHSVTSGAPPRCLDILKAWTGIWSTKSTADQTISGGSGSGSGRGRGRGARASLAPGDLESPTSTLSFSEIAPPPPPPITQVGSSTEFFEFVGSSMKEEAGEEEEEEEWKGVGELTEYKDGTEASSSSMNCGAFQRMGVENGWASESLKHFNEHVADGSFIERFTDLLLHNSNARGLSENGGDSDNGSGGSDYCNEEDNKNYWNDFFNLVNSSPSSSDSPVF